MRRRRDGDRAAANLAGSIGFGVSAVTSLVEPSTQEPVSARITNAATAVGALCFLAGAVMLLPRSGSSDSDEVEPRRVETLVP
jgi:hypothetical protein